MGLIECYQIKYIFNYLKFQEKNIISFRQQITPQSPINHPEAAPWNTTQITYNHVRETYNNDKNAHL